MNDNKQNKKIIEARSDEVKHKEELRREEEKRSQVSIAEGRSIIIDGQNTFSWEEPKAITLEMSEWGCKGEILFQYRWGNGGSVFYCEILQYRITGSDLEGDRSKMGFSAESLGYWVHNSGNVLVGNGGWQAHYQVSHSIVVGNSVSIHGRFEFDHNAGWPGAEQFKELKYPN